jgi:phosphoribosylformylglycinamidine synthase
VKIGVVTFPGSLDDRDAQRAVRRAGGEAVALWHGDHDLQGVEAIVLPGGLIRNDHGDFVCRDQRLRVGNASTAWTTGFEVGQEITIPLKNAEGGFIVDAETLKRIEGEGQVAFRYLDVNPNGSLDDIAGLTNAGGNVVGLMPHPEHATEPGFGPDTPDAMRSGTDGLTFFTSVLESALARV